MSQASRRRKRSPQLELFALNLEYAMNRGMDIENRVIQLTEDIEDHHFDFFDAAMTCLESVNRKTITVKINSYGGDVHSALGIIGRMRESKCIIETKGYGKIMSAATAILAAGSPGKRKISSLAQVMHHEPSYSVEGRHSEIEHEVKNSQQLAEVWCDLMFELTGVPKDYWLTKGRLLDFNFDARTALELNIVDGIF